MEDDETSSVRHEGWEIAEYCAPEIHRMMEYDPFPVDIWSASQRESLTKYYKQGNVTLLKLNKIHFLLIHSTHSQ